MNIKDRKTEWKLPKILFIRNTSNGIFVMFLSLILINISLYLVEYDHLGLIPSGFIVFGLYLFATLMVVVVGEAFTGGNQNENKSDYKKSLLYMGIYILITGSMHYYNVKNAPLPPAPKVYEYQLVKIDQITVYDVHKKKNTYAIGYLADNKTMWIDLYESGLDRDTMLKELIDDDKKLKVEINFTRSAKGVTALEVLKYKSKKD